VANPSTLLRTPQVLVSNILIK